MKKHVVHFDRGHDIEIYQNTESLLFSVRYGKKVSDGLSYEQAAREIVACMLHSLFCDNVILEENN